MPKTKEKPNQKTTVYSSHFSAFSSLSLSLSRYILLLFRLFFFVQLDGVEKLASHSLWKLPDISCTINSPELFFTTKKKESRKKKHFLSDTLNEKWLNLIFEYFSLLFLMLLMYRYVRINGVEHFLRT